MQKVALVQMVYNGMKYIPRSFTSMINQTYQNIEVIAVINGNDDNGKEYIQENFPSVTIIDPGENLRFVKGHNLVFAQSDADLFQLVNQDLFLAPNYVEEMVKVMESDETIGAVNGKIFQYNFDTDENLELLDTTGISISKSGGARSRGQHQADNGQFDSQLDLISVDGAACMYRKSALESVKYHREDGTVEYFDVDFEMYWEDVDLGWRMVNAGWKCKFVPSALGYHGRTAAASPGGYKKVFAFIRHHRAIPQWIREFNYKNHIFLFIKNSPKWYWQFFVREISYQFFVLILETSTLKILPRFFAELPKMFTKRNYIARHRKIEIVDLEKLFS